jgi:hypothetical protein
MVKQNDVEHHGNGIRGQTNQTDPNWVTHVVKVADSKRVEGIGSMGGANIWVMIKFLFDTSIWRDIRDRIWSCHAKSVSCFWRDSKLGFCCSQARSYNLQLSNTIYFLRLSCSMVGRGRENVACSTVHTFLAVAFSLFLYNQKKILTVDFSSIQILSRSELAPTKPWWKQR